MIKDQLAITRSILGGGAPLAYPTAATFAYETLRAWIVDGRIPPGERVELGEVAGRLGLSTTPVRQALQRLEGEGLVTSEPHRGAAARELSRAELEEVYALRRRLEGWAVELACARLDDADRREIGERFARLDAAAPEDYARANREFHARIFQAAGQPLLQRFLAVLWDLSERYRQDYLQRPAQLRRSRADHRRLLELLLAGEPAEAGRLVTAHNERTKEMVLRERYR